MFHPLLDPHRRLRNGWWILIFFATLGALVVPTTLLASARGFEVGPGLQALLAAIATALCLGLRREHPASVLGTLTRWRRDAPAGLALGAGLWVTTALLLWATGHVTWAWQGSLQALFAGALACLGVAVVEELVFRGFVFQRLVEGIGAWPAQIAMAAYFVLTHAKGLESAGDLKTIATINIFLAGLMFGAAWLSTRSLALPIALHFSLNFVQGPVLGFGISGTTASGMLQPALDESSPWWTGGAFGLEASIPGTVLIAAAWIALATWRRRSTKTETIGA
jgi:membrane protease YdiL (CAAX protease family)